MQRGSFKGFPVTVSEASIYIVWICALELGAGPCLNHTRKQQQGSQNWTFDPSWKRLWVCFLVGEAELEYLCLSSVNLLQAARGRGAEAEDEMASPVNVFTLWGGEGEGGRQGAQMEPQGRNPDGADKSPCDSDYIRGKLLGAPVRNGQFGLCLCT